MTDDLEPGEGLRERFERQIRGVRFVMVASPYRQLVRPPIRYVPRHWLERYLFNDNARRVRDGLLGRSNTLVAEVPFRREV